MNCQNCGTPCSVGGLSPKHCGDCPPWECGDCGAMDSAQEPCGCWVSFEGMPMADIKGHLADAGLSLDHRSGYDRR